MSDFPEEFLEFLHSIKAKRPRTVIDHILKYGQVTTEELKEQYGYDHPPRAARDVREAGIPLETFWVTASHGRKIAAYRFGDPAKIRPERAGGRTVLSREIKERLVEEYGSICFIYLEELNESFLQIDHRIPYEIAGEEEVRTQDPDDFMLLCGSANRAKSWSCEHCDNWNGRKDRRICRTCYWAYPESYSHVAMRRIRRLDLMWTDHGVAQYDELRKRATNHGSSLPDFVKEILRRQIDGDPAAE